MLGLSRQRRRKSASKPNTRLLNDCEAGNRRSSVESWLRATQNRRHSQTSQGSHLGQRRPSFSRGRLSYLAHEGRMWRLQMRYRSVLVILGATLSAAGVQAQVSPGQSGAGAQPDQTNPGTQSGAGSQSGSGAQAPAGSATPSGIQEPTGGQAPTGTQTPSATPTPSGTQTNTDAPTNTETQTNSAQASQANTETDHVSRCKARYRTYNARTDMFYARPGVRRRCRL